MENSILIRTWPNKNVETNVDLVWGRTRNKHPSKKVDLVVDLTDLITPVTFHVMATRKEALRVNEFDWRHFHWSTTSGYEPPPRFLFQDSSSHLRKNRYFEWIPYQDGNSGSMRLIASYLLLFYRYHYLLCCSILWIINHFSLENLPARYHFKLYRYL